MARRRRSMVLGILGGVIVLLLVIVALAPFLVPREHLRSVAEQQVRAATGGDASLGPVSLRILPRLRLVLGRSSVHVSADGLRGAGQDPGSLLNGAVELERLEVDLALWPLLRRQLEFGEIRLMGPRLELSTRPPVEPDAEPTEGAAATTPPAAAADFGLVLAAVQVRDGEIIWREADTNREVVLRGWQQEMTAPQLGVFLQRLQRLDGADLPADPVPEAVTLALDVRVAELTLAGFGEKPVPPLADLHLRAELSVPPAADRVEFAVRELTLPGWRATAGGHGTAAQVTVTTLALDGGQALALSGSASFAPPPASGPLAVNLSGSVDLARILDQLAPWLPAAAAEAPPPPDLTGTLQIALTAALPAPPSLADPQAWTAAWRQGLAGQATLTAGGGPITVTTPQLGEPLRLDTIELTSDLRAASGKTRVIVSDVAHPALRGRAEAEIVPAAGEDQAIQARVQLTRLDLDALAALAEARAAAGPQAGAGWDLLGVGTAWAAGAAGQPHPGELIPPELAVDLQATVREMVFLRSPYTNVQLAGRLRERVIDVPDFSAQLGAGRVAGTAQVDYAVDPRGRASWDVRVQDAPAGLMLSPYLPVVAAIWTGALSATAKGACDLTDPKAILNSLRLAGDLQGDQGVIDLREQLSGVNQYLGQRQDLLQVRYNQAYQQFKIEDGKVQVQGLRIAGRDTDWQGGGWIGLDGTLNLDLNVRLPAGFTPNLGDLTFLADGLRDKDGRISLDFSLTGDARRPAVNLNLDPAALLQSDAMQQKLKGEGQEQLRKLQDEVKKGAGGLLDRLRGGK